MPEINSKTKTPGEREHSLTLTGRRELCLSGIRDILSFDAEEAELLSSMGRILVEGEELKIGVLDTESGNVTLTGKISALVYKDEDGEVRRGLFRGRR